MVDIKENIEHKDQAPSSPEKQGGVNSHETKEGLGSSRSDIAGTLAEGGESAGEMVESGETVSEVASESSERKSQGVKTGKGDDGTGDDSTAGDDDFTFDEKNLPPAPAMIKKIEKRLRSEINSLEKEAKKYSGGWFFGKPDYPKYSETVGEIRKKNVLLSRLLNMAAESLKKLFVQMFGPKKISK